jgi:hypothetical protein
MALPLILKRASASRPSGEWNGDDFDVLAGGAVVGRIFKADAAPVGSPWMWTLAFGHHEESHANARLCNDARRPDGRIRQRRDGRIGQKLAAGILRIPYLCRSACCLFVSLALAALVGTPTAHAVCRSPKNICKHIDDCLERGSGNKDAERIREGVRTRDGKMVFAGAEACARDFGKKRQWDSWTRGCSDVEYFAIAKVEMEIGKDYCDRYSQ